MNKVNVKPKLAMAAVIISLVFAGCSDYEEPIPNPPNDISIVGMWANWNQNNSDVWETFVFNDDGTFSTDTAVFYPGKTKTYSGTYQIDRNKIIFTYDGDNAGYDEAFFELFYEYAKHFPDDYRKVLIMYFNREEGLLITRFQGVLISNFNDR